MHIKQLKFILKKGTSGQCKKNVPKTFSVVMLKCQDMFDRCNFFMLTLQVNYTLISVILKYNSHYFKVYLIYKPISFFCSKTMGTGLRI